MFELLKRLLGAEHSSKASTDDSDPGAESGQLGSSASDRYFQLLGQLQEAKGARDWERAAKVARKQIGVMPGLVEEWQDSYGDLPPSLPLFTDGARAFAITGDSAALQQLRSLTQQFPELAERRPDVEAALVDCEIVPKIRQVLARHPGILQTDMKDATGATDGRRLATLLRQLAECGEIQRIRYKRTWVLGPSGVDLTLPDDHPAQAAHASAPEDEVGIAAVFDANHQRRAPLEPREVALDALDYVPLPRAPHRWDERHKKAGAHAGARKPFEFGDGTPWQIGRVDKLTMQERPDTAYRKLAPHAAGTFLIDDLGKAQRYPGTPAALQSVGRMGELQAEAPLAWGLYRWHVNPMGEGFIAMDANGVIHAYDKQLNRLFATPVGSAPEVSGLALRYDFDAGSLKNHTRTVALSPTGNRYLFTVVDCAFVIGSDGAPHWSLQLPKQDGWTQVAEVSPHAGTRAQVVEAMRLLELEPPISVDDIRRSYRRLAQRWHPDKNQGSGEAEERFKRIAWAAEVMSGLDPSSLAPDVTRPIYYEQGAHQQTWEIEGMQFTNHVGLVASEKQASDWIYASSFARDGGAFLAGYSGRVIRTDGRGTPVRAYDIGAVPRRVADTGDYLYFLTDTRLYILRDRALIGLLDIFNEGELIVGQTGFGLLEKKRFRWFTETGDPIGTVLTKNPIRRVHSTPAGLVVETRQRRALISGAPGWWED